MELIANELPKFGQDIEDYQSAYKDLLQNYELLISHMQSLGTMWEGEAHNQLMDTFVTDTNRIKEMLDLLQEISGNLVFANTEYTRCEGTVAGIIDSINV